MTGKVLYSLGVACWPHSISREKYPNITSPSLFAGHAYLQDECNFFIPKILFDGTIKHIWFGLDNWDILQKDKNRSIYMNVRLNQFFQYDHNLKHRHFIECNDFKPDGKEYYINKFLPIINFHPNEKCPGINPKYKEYQYEKYNFFINHRYEQYFLIETNKYMTKAILADFLNYVSNDGYNTDNFLVFDKNYDYSHINIQTVKRIQQLI